MIGYTRSSAELFVPTLFYHVLGGEFMVGTPDSKKLTRHTLGNLAIATYEKGSGPQLEYPVPEPNLTYDYHPSWAPSVTARAHTGQALRGRYPLHAFSLVPPDQTGLRIQYAAGEPLQVYQGDAARELPMKTAEQIRLARESVTSMAALLFRNLPPPSA